MSVILWMLQSLTDGERNCLSNNVVIVLAATNVGTSRIRVYPWNPQLVAIEAASSQEDTGLWASRGIHYASKATYKTDPIGITIGVVNCNVKSSGTAFSSEDKVTDYTEITAGGLEKIFNK
jgi:hypothetical protein